MGNLVIGNKTGITETATPVATVATPCLEVLLQADDSNTVNLLVGDSGIQPFILAPGKSIAVPSTDVNELYVKLSAAGTGEMAWWAKRY